MDMPVVTFFQLVTHGVKARGAEVALQARAFQLAVASLLGGKQGAQEFDSYLEMLQGKSGITAEEVLRRL